MSQVQVGKVTIPYDIRRSPIAQKKSIIVRPHHVEVVAPEAVPETDISAFVQKKRHWVFNKLTEMNERLAYLERHSYDRLRSGAKIRFRGRNVALRVRQTDQPNIDIRYNGGFDITAPANLSAEALEAALGQEIVAWFSTTLKADVEALRKRYERATGLVSAGSQVIHSDTLWASLTRSGVIRVNWHLIEAPKVVLEYVVLHELCHSVHRNHTPEFWALIAKHMPDYPSRKRWLENLMPSFRL